MASGPSSYATDGEDSGGKIFGSAGPSSDAPRGPSVLAKCSGSSDTGPSSCDAPSGSTDAVPPGRPCPRCYDADEAAGEAPEPAQSTVCDRTRTRDTGRGAGGGGG